MTTSAETGGTIHHDLSVTTHMRGCCRLNTRHRPSIDALDRSLGCLSAGAPRRREGRAPAPASSPARPTRAEWVRIAIFGIPYAAFFLVGVPTSLFPASWH